MFNFMHHFCNVSKCDHILFNELVRDKSQFYDDSYQFTLLKKSFDTVLCKYYTAKHLETGLATKPRVGHKTKGGREAPSCFDILRMQNRALQCAK